MTEKRSIKGIVIEDTFIDSHCPTAVVAENMKICLYPILCRFAFIHTDVQNVRDRTSLTLEMSECILQ
jgi:hypothetical protein